MGSSFAIDDVHIGPPCHKSCSGDDRCVSSSCECDKRFNGKYVSSFILSDFVKAELVLTNVGG